MTLGVEGEFGENLTGTIGLWSVYLLLALGRALGDYLERFFTPSGPNGKEVDW